MKYKWEWLENGHEKIVSIVFSDDPEVELFQRIASEALPDFKGRKLKVLVDSQANKASVGHEGFVTLIQMLKRAGINELVYSVRISDRFYDSKIEMFQMYARKERFDLKMRQFEVFEDAERWVKEA